MDDLDKLPSLNVRALPRRATSSLADITNPNCCAPEETMTNERPSPIAPMCLVVGALLGLAGSFAASASLRGLAWGVDGTALIVGAALLAVHFIRCAQN